MEVSARAVDGQLQGQAGNGGGHEVKEVDLRLALIGQEGVVVLRVVSIGWVECLIEERDLGEF